MAATPPGAKGAFGWTEALTIVTFCTQFAPRASRELLRCVGAPGNGGQDVFEGAPGRGDLGLGAGEPEAPEGSERDHLEEVDLGGLLRLVGGDGGVARRVHLEDEQRLALGDHVA